MLVSSCDGAMVVECPHCGLKTLKMRTCIYCGRELEGAPVRVSAVEREEGPAIGEEVGRDELDILEASYGDFEALEDLWNRYEESAEAVLKEWSSRKAILLRKISYLEGNLDRCRDELEELEARLELGISEGEGCDGRMSDLRMSIDLLGRRIRELKKGMEAVEAKARQHGVRLRITAEIPAVEEIRDKLERLEEMKSRGRIAEEVYEMLKLELRGMLEAAAMSRDVRKRER